MLMIDWILRFDLLSFIASFVQLQLASMSYLGNYFAPTASWKFLGATSAEGSAEVAPKTYNDTGFEMYRFSYRKWEQYSVIA